MHLEALTSNAKKLWPKLKYFSDFTLVGGTALALQIGHRVSIDFDFFSKNPLPPTIIRRIRYVFRGSRISTVRKLSDQLTVSVDGITITFVEYPFPVYQRRISFEGVRMLPVLEIAAAKAYTMGRRATYKDYADLYFIVSEKRCSLPQVLALAKRRYKDEFNGRLFLEQLVYLKDIREVPLAFIKKPAGKAEIEKFFRQEIKKIKL